MHLVPQARDEFKTEYEVLCKLPFHENIIKLHAFFFARFDPGIHPSLKEIAGSRSISLFLVMEFHTNSMRKLMEDLHQKRGPRVRLYRRCFLWRHTQ
jgi:serine/threonine protein kinase